MIEKISPELLKAQKEILENSLLKENQLNGVGEKGPAFSDILTDMIGNVDEAQKAADTSIRKLAEGESTNIQDVVLKLEEADIAFQLMKEVRNKLVEAYKELMSMGA